MSIRPSRSSDLASEAAIAAAVKSLPVGPATSAGGSAAAGAPGSATVRFIRRNRLRSHGRDGCAEPSLVATATPPRPRIALPTAASAVPRPYEGAVSICAMP